MSTSSSRFAAAIASWTQNTGPTHDDDPTKPQSRPSPNIGLSDTDVIGPAALWGILDSSSPTKTPPTAAEKKRLANKKKNDERKARKKVQKTAAALGSSTLVSEAHDEQEELESLELVYWGPYIATSPSGDTLGFGLCARGCFAIPKHGIEVVLKTMLEPLSDDEVKAWVALVEVTDSRPFFHCPADEEGRRPCEVVEEGRGRIDRGGWTGQTVRGGNAAMLDEIEEEKEVVVRREPRWVVNMDPTRPVVSGSPHMTDTEIN